MTIKQGCSYKVNKKQLLLKRFDLDTMMVPAATMDIVQRRIAGLWQMAFDGCSIDRLPELIKRFGQDCYTQGLLDGTSPQVRARVEKMVLEGLIPPMVGSPPDGGANEQ